MKKIVLLAAFLMPLGLCAQNRQAADAAYENGRFEEALKYYQEELKTAKGNDLYQARLRTVASQYMLGKYMAAAQSAFSFPLPDQPVWKARFLLYRIKTAERVQNLYRPALSDSDQDGADLPDLSPAQWNDKINECFEDLWSLRTALINAPIEKETLILETKNTDVKAVPTLFDFVVLQWTQRLQNAASPITPLRARQALSPDYKAPAHNQNDAQKLVSVLAEAARLGGKDRADARIIWQAQRLALPLREERLFSFEDKQAEHAEAVRLLQILSGYTREKKGFLAQISRALTNSKADYGRSYAAWTAAQFLNNQQEYVQAVALCDWTAENLGDNYYAKSCARMAAEIRQPVLDVKSPAFNQNPKEAKISFSARNTPAVYARLYPVTQEDLVRWNKRDNTNSWRYLTRIPSDQTAELLARTPLAKMTVSVTYKKPHAYTEGTLNLPELKRRGFYAVALTYDQNFDPQQAPVYTAVLNNTELALFASAAIEADPADYHTRQNKTFTPGVFRIYTLNLKTGEPVPGADVTYFTDWKGSKSTGKTNENGLLTLTRKISTNKSNSYFILPKAVKDGNTALLPGSVYFSYYPEDPVRLYPETDRAVYRPGQTVRLAVYGFERAGRGQKTLAQNTQVTLTVRDANYEKVSEQKLKLNAYGTAQTELTLPETGLLGRYGVECTLTHNGRTSRGYAGFRVEEYKRPEYEITLNPAGALQYGKEAQVTGKAQYYFGAPMEKAAVKYTVTRSVYRPPFWWWRSLPANEGNKFIAEGETHTNADGSFKIVFTPKAGSDETFPSVFHVTATVMDASGRAIDAQRDYKASDKAFFFQTSFTKGFYDADTESALASVKLTDINAEPVQGKFTAEIYELENVFKEKTDDRAIAFAAESNPLENWYGKNKELRKVSSRSYHLKKGEEAFISLPALPEGIYKLKLRGKNADATDLVFLVAQQKSALALPAVAIAQHEKYYPGSQAKILIGAGGLTGAKRVEIYEEGQFLAARELLGPGAGIYSLPIQNDWRGGVYLRWFGAGDYRFYTAQTFVDVPYDNKALSLDTAVPAAVKPGSRENWKVTVKDASGNAVNAQASVRVYDKSLDYYAKTELPFSLDSLYPKPSFNASLADSAFAASVIYNNDAPHDSEYVQAPVMPRLNLQPYFIRYASFNAARATGAVLMKSAAPQAARAVLTDAAEEETAFDMAAVKPEASAVEGGAEQTQVRSDFSETAYFNPMLPITGGKGTVSFTMPQSLTGWNVAAFVLTKNADFGSFTAQTVTQKDVTVRLSLPRFWREGDLSTLTAQISNLTDKKRTAEITLNVTLDGKEAAADFGLTQLTQTVSVPAKGNVPVTWPIQVPHNTGIVNITATVRAGADTDAESRQFPLLPAKERLAESVTAALESGSQTLQLDNLLVDDPTREVSVVTLRIDPGLLLSVLNAMPQLLRPGYNDALSVADRYVPLAVVNSFYKTYPLLQDAVAKLPKRDTQTPAWDNQDPARLTLLEETPWLSQAQGGAKRQAFLTDLFNPAAVEKARALAEKNLTKYQTASGGYCWMPGGEASEFITMRLLSSYAQILRYGGEIPQAPARKALAWLAPRIEKNLKQSEASASAVAHALYAAYVFTAFPQSWKEVQNAPVANWLDYADKHAAYMTPLGQTYAAAAYYRQGRDTKAQNYLDLVLSRMKTDPVTGAYFAPEAQSWLWYNDTLTTQTATLRTLLEIRPESDKAAELVKWLLFNRKAQAWRSTAATAEAVYALLDYMQRNGLLDDPAEYMVAWGDKKETLRVDPFDWTERLSWTQEAQNVEPKYYTAQVTKRGGLTGFATLDAVYTTADARPSAEGVINVKREYLLKYIENGRDKVRPLRQDEPFPAGSEVEVRLTLTASSAFDYVLLSDPKPAGFETAELLSGWSWDPLPAYRENRDAATRFFLDRVPAGTYTLRYTLRPTLEGKYHALPAQVQSVYAPEFSAHTAAETLSVK